MVEIESGENLCVQLSHFGGRHMESFRHGQLLPKSQPPSTDKLGGQSGEKAMDILLILTNVLSKMDVPTLKTARLVSRRWNREASRILLQKNLCRFGYTIDPAVSHAENLPCSDFYFWGHILEQTDVREFIRLFRLKIKTLTVITHNTSERSMETVCHKISLILRHCPHIHQVIFNRAFCLHEWRGQSNLTTLPAMKRLSILSDSEGRDSTAHVNSIVYRILEASPTLKRVDNLWIREPSEGHPANFWDRYSQLVRKFRFNSRHMSLDELYGFSHTNVKLQSIAVGALHPEVTALQKREYDLNLLRILNSSAKTLEVLEISSGFFSLPKNRLPIPQLSKLKTLKLRISPGLNLDYYFDEEYCRANPGGNDLQKMLPTLKKVCFQIAMKHSDDWEMLSDLQNIQGNSNPGNPRFSNNFPSVDTLEFSGHFESFLERNWNWEINESSGWMKRVRDLFPNVTRVTVKYSTNLETILPQICESWPKLHSLKFGLPFQVQKMEEFSTTYGFPNLDHIFTGTGGKNHLNTGHLNKSLKLVNNSQTKSVTTCSMMSLTELKKLDIVCGMKTDTWPAGIKLPVSTAVCQQLLEQLPKLQMTFQFNRNHPSVQPAILGVEESAIFSRINFANIEPSF